MSHSNYMRREFLYHCLFCLLFIAATPLYAQEPPNVIELTDVDPGLHLLGDLGRANLEDQGYRIEAYAIHDFWVNTRGGNNRGGGVFGNMNLVLTVDTEKAGWWNGGSFVMWGIGIYGRRPSLAVGDFQYTSSIDAFETVEPYEMYYEHAFLDGSLSVLAGIHDYTLEFAVLDYAYTLVNSSFSTPSTIAQYPGSFYPTTGLGTRASLQVTDEAYLMVGAYDGRPTDPNNMRDKNWGISEREGIYSIAELGWIEDEAEKLHSKFSIGGWYNSGTFEDGLGVERTGNYGTYLLGEQELWREQEGTDQGFGAFMQVGQARNDRNINPWYFGGGFRYKGLVEGRDEDVVGIGYAHAQMSSQYREYAETTEKSERTFELHYRAKLTSSIIVTPDVQYVIDPFVNPELDNALILYLRTEVAF